MKRAYVTVALTCIIILFGCFGWFKFLNLSGTRDDLKVGFIYDNDESTPYTYNFSIAKDAVEKKYGSQVEIMTCSNVLDDQIEKPIRELASNGCDIIFFNGYSDMVVDLAPNYPDIQFCQASYMDMSRATVPPNYHTFKGEAYQGRYVTGIIAGMKINEMISEGVISRDQALVGFVAAFPTSEVISGYTAFLLGVRSVVPNATMRVYYTQTWSSYAQEKSAAHQLIDEGCVIISQYTDTIGPALACEEASQNAPVYFIGYNQSMSEVAPGTSLATSRICWEPYVVSAVDAVMSRKSIESVVSGHIHGTDVSAGFENGWVEIMDLNPQTAAEGTQEVVDSVIDQFRHGKVDFVFKGDYTGINPNEPEDTCDLSEGYIENENTSFPTFHYILSDIITIDFDPTPSPRRQ